MNVSVQKTVALVCALAKLHNFCIDEDGTDVPSATEHDEWTGEMTGAIRLVESEEHTGAMVPEQLLHAGEHFDDIGHRGVYNRQRRYGRMREASGTSFPREALHSAVADAGLTRPIVQGSRG